MAETQKPVRELPVEITDKTQNLLVATLGALALEGFACWGFIFRCIETGAEGINFTQMETFNNGNRTPEEMKQDTLDFFTAMEDQRIKDAIKHSPVALPQEANAFVEDKSRMN